MVKKVIKITLFSLLFAVVFVSLCFGALLLESAIIKKGVMVYNDNLLNTTIMAPYDVSSTAKFLSMVEEEKLYYINPSDVGENPTSIAHSYNYLDKNGIKTNYAISSSISYPSVNDEIKYISLTIINNPKESTLSKLVGIELGYSYSDRINRGIIATGSGYRKINNKKCRIESYIYNFSEEGEAFYCNVYYKQKDYQLVLGLGIDIAEERDFDSLEDKCVKKAEEIVNLVKKG